MTTGRPSRSQYRPLLPPTVLLSLALAGRADAQALMNYRDAGETAIALQALSLSRHAQLHVIGHSLDFKTDPKRPAIYPVHALRVSGSTDEATTDDSRRNAILFECGSHPREWLATESCLMLAEHLVTHAEDAASGVPALLANVDVWIVPLTTAAGRAIDDTHGGDPRRFHTSISSAGWRGNGDTRGCRFGINVARNFSADWTGEPSATCTDANYRGFAPFASLEAVALRQFVQNHSIAMAVVVHSNATKISNLWRAADTGGTAIADLAKFSWDLLARDVNVELTRSTNLGSGLGQFSAWLSAISDTPGQPDLGTRRSIQTVFVELPFLDADLNSSVAVDAYNLGTYRFAADDGSNGFHPSSDGPVRDLVRGSFLLMAKVLIQEARAPGCTTIDGCPALDFGLVGAKVGRSSLDAGLIQTNAAGCFGQQLNGRCTGTLVPARDYVQPGSYYLDYRVQNFSGRSGNDDVAVTVTVEETVTLADGTITSRSASTQTLRDLARTEARTGRVAVNLGTSGADYTITVQIAPAGGSLDRFSPNDSKVFKVRAR